MQSTLVRTGRAALVASVVAVMGSPPAAEADSRAPDLALMDEIHERAAERRATRGVESETTDEARSATRRTPASAAASSSPYHDLIRRHAAEAGIPVELARAVVRIESNFNARARGRAGEVGLMQIKPRTARGIGYTGAVEALYDPNTNLRWGMKYLAGAYQRAGGDICGTVMRYQGGHYATRMTGANRTYCARVKQIMGRGTEVASAS